MHVRRGPAQRGDEGKLSLFEMKISFFFFLYFFKRIYGPMFNVDSEVFERRKNKDLQRLYNKPNICKIFSSKRLEYRLDTCGVQKDVLQGKCSMEI
jgi:hypothetical protein